jgi:threonine aldolase
MTHCGAGDEVILADGCHIVQHERGASGILSGVQLRCVECADGRPPLSAIEKRIRKSDDQHHPRTGLICLENADSNGLTLPISYMEDVSALARRYGIPLHLDGARIFNAAEYLRVEAGEIARHCDSVMFCLSKGLCAPVGSMLAGSAGFIARARKNRKAMGGAMRQAGVLGAAGLIALNEMRHRLGKDHRLTRFLGKRFGEIDGVTVRQEDIHINMVFCAFDFKPPMNAELFARRLREAGVLANAPEDGVVRFVTHNGVREQDAVYAAEAVRGIMTRDFW